MQTHLDSKAKPTCIQIVCDFFEDTDISTELHPRCIGGAERLKERSIPQRWRNNHIEVMNIIINSLPCASRSNKNDNFGCFITGYRIT